MNNEEHAAFMAKHDAAVRHVRTRILDHIGAAEHALTEWENIVPALAGRTLLDVARAHADVAALLIQMRPELVNAHGANT